MEYHCSIIPYNQIDLVGYDKINKACKAQSMDGKSPICKCPADECNNSQCNFRTPHLLLFFEPELDKLKKFQKLHTQNYHKYVTYCDKNHTGGICSFGKDIKADTKEIQP